MSNSQATRRVVAGLILGVALTPIPAAALAAAPPSTEPSSPADAEAALIAAVAPVASFSGTGTQAIDISTLPEESYVMDVTYDGNSDSLQDLTIEVLDTTFEADYRETVEVPSYTMTVPFSGRFPINMPFYGSGNYAKFLQVEAEGSWTIDIMPWAAVQSWHGGEAHAVGPTVLDFDGEPGQVSFAHNAPNEYGDFAVTLLVSGELDQQVVIDETGTAGSNSVEGTAFLTGSPAVVIVDAAGEWWLRR